MRIERKKVTGTARKKTQDPRKKTSGGRSVTPRYRKSDSDNDDYKKTSRVKREGDERKPYRKKTEESATSRPRKRDNERSASRVSRSNSDKPYESRPRRKDDSEYKPRFKKADDGFKPPRSPRGSSDKPYESRPRRKDDSEYKPRFKKTDDGFKPRSSRGSSDKPYESRPRRKDDSEYKPRFKKTDDGFKPRSSRGSSDKPYSGQSRYRSEIGDKPRVYKRKEMKSSTTVIQETGKMVDEDIRLNKFLANSGLCSRREADEYIGAGLVTVNGKIVTELGTKVKASDDIRFNGERMKGEQKVYIVMNKPKDYVTTLGDPHAKQTVMDLISTEKCPVRVYPVGRLDKNTTGVLLLTNDGDLTEKLTHPSLRKKKIYHVCLDRNVKIPDLRKLLEGVTLEDGLSQADHVEYVDGDKSQVGLEIHSGRNRVVRRMFEALDYKITKLDRVYFAGLTKKNLSRGQWRFLTEQEIAALRMGAYE